MTDYLLSLSEGNLAIAEDRLGVETDRAHAGAVLVSRLHLLPRAEVEAELERLEVVVGKTAGAAEAEAGLAQGQGDGGLCRRLHRGLRL